MLSCPELLACRQATWSPEICHHLWCRCRILRTAALWYARRSGQPDALAQLADGCIFAHARGNKVYLTLNNLPTNDELTDCPSISRTRPKPGWMPLSLRTWAY